MHDTAYEIGELFFQRYVSAGNFILDIGSMDINGSLHDFRPEGSGYVGVDLAAGNGVDVVIKTNSQLPFAKEVFDIVVSTSCFEHDMNVLANFSGDVPGSERGRIPVFECAVTGGVSPISDRRLAFFPRRGHCAARLGKVEQA